MSRGIAVIGSGPAGLAAAEEAARRGIKVTVFEKGRVGDEIQCGEGLFDPQRILGQPEEGVRFKVKAIRFRVREEFEFDTTSLPLWIIDRREWQRHWARKVEAQGAEIREQEPISRRNLAPVKANFDWIIDASGVPSITSMVCGFRDFYYPHSLVTAQYQMRGNFRDLQEKIKVGLGPDFLGYYWIFPQGQEVAKVGLALLPETFGPRDINSLWLKLRQVLEREGLAGMEILERSGGLCPAKVLPSLVWDKMISVGDAAGFTSPLHGGGIDLAVLSGREAVKAIAAGEVENYRERMLELIGPRLEQETRVAQLWAGSDLEEMDRLLAGVNNLIQGGDIGALLPLSRALLEKGYELLNYWQALEKGSFEV